MYVQLKPVAVVHKAAETFNIQGGISDKLSS